MGSAVGKQEFADALGALSAALEAVQAEVGRMEAANARLRAALADGVASDLLLTESGWAAARTALLEATSELGSHLKQSRSEYVRILVDDDGLSISEAARVLGHPRQLTKRVYDARNDGQRPLDTA